MLKQIRVKYAGKCSTCGGTIPRGALAIWHKETRSLEHDSESVACFQNRKGAMKYAEAVDPNNAHDMLIEDQMADVCGLLNE